MNDHLKSTRRTEASSCVHGETYRGYELRVIHVTRTNSPLMESEFIVFVGGDPVYDELETLQESIAAGRKAIDLCIIATNGA